MILDERDISFLFSWLDVAALTRCKRYSMHDADVFDAIVSLAGQISERELASHLRASDMTEPKLEHDGTVTLQADVARAVGVMAEAGMFSTVFDEEMGGLQIPHVVHMAALGILMAGNISTASFALLTIANARLIATYGTAKQQEAFAAPQIAGETMGTMCLSEPHAGSSLGHIRSRATPDGSGYVW